MESKTMVWVVFALMLSLGAGSTIWGDNSSDIENVIVSVNGVEPTAENISDGSYDLCRDLALVINENNLKPAAADFINWILSKEGQEIVGESGFVSIDPVERVVSATSGTVTITGSTTVLPLMTKLVEIYEKSNNVTVNVMGGGSGKGVNDVKNGNADIGMLSKDLKTDDTSLNVIPIAIDGVVIIVDKSANITDLSTDQIAKIFAGVYTNWNQIYKNDTGTYGNDMAINPIVRDIMSGTRNTLDAMVMDLLDECFDNLTCKYISGGYPVMGSTGSMISYAGNTNGAIGYINMYGAKNL